MNFNTLNEALDYRKTCPICGANTKLVNCSVTDNNLVVSGSAFTNEDNASFDLFQKNSYRPNVCPQSVEWGYSCYDYEAKFLTSYHFESGNVPSIRNILLSKEIVFGRGKRYDSMILNHARRNVTLIRGSHKETFDKYGYLKDIIEKMDAITNY